MRRILLSVATLVFLISLVSCAFAAETTVAKADPAAKTAFTGPVWSPNGKSVAYVGMTYSAVPSEPTYAKTDKNVYVATGSGSKWTQRIVAKNADWPVWSPDGKQLAVNQGGLVIVDLATGKTKRLTKDKGLDPEGEGTELHRPISWSPNGKYIVYQTIWMEGSADFVRDLKTGKDRKICENGDAIWMADGKLLVAQRTMGEESVGSMLKILDPATGNARTVVKDQYVRKAFIPKGAGYAWVWLPSTAPKGEGIYKVDLKKGVLSKQVAVRAKEIHWSPDAKQFVFFTEYSPKAGVEPKSTLYVGETKLWTFKIASKDAGKTEDWRQPHAGWSPNSKSIAHVSEAGDIRVLTF